MNESLKKVLNDLYVLLREEGFSSHLIPISKLIYYAENNDVKNYKKAFKSSLIWGGAGSIRDIDLRDPIKQNELNNYLKVMKDLSTIL